MSGRIVVGVDDSEGSRAALRWALRESLLRDAVVDAVHTWSDPALYAPYALGETVNVRTAMEEGARTLLATEVEAALRDCPGPRVEQVLVDGSASRSLIDASRGAELVVVGSRGRGGFTGLLLGSVSQQVAHHAHCPIVIVPSAAA